MTRTVVLVLIGFVVLLCSGLLVTAGLEGLAHASTDPNASLLRSNDGVYLSHEVKAGETLYRIAETYYNDARRWEEIAHANSISSPGTLKAGQIITIPFPADAPSPGPSVVEGAGDAPKTNAVEIKNESRRPLVSDVVIGMVKMRAADESLGEFLLASIIREPKRFRIAVAGYCRGVDHQLYNDVFDEQEGNFLSCFTADRNRDGTDELYTVWTQKGGRSLTRVISMTPRGFAFTEALYDDPYSLTQNWLTACER